MHKISLAFFIGIIFFTISNAQQKEEVLLTIDQTPVNISEFKRVYLKNIELVKDDAQKNVDEYLELFISYKLKLREAVTLNLDKKETYQKELEGYRKQLAKGYLTDTRSSEVMIKEAYDRSLERVNASHILITLQPNASVEDTLVAHQKISEIRNKILQGESFTDVAKAHSQDPSAVKNGGDLGWFSVFRMVYPFENAAYNTKIGEVSKPFKTQFGYHIMKVNKREKRLGEVTVAHIMIAVNEKRTEEEARQRIKEINQQIEQGVSFESLAKQYSDDPSTAIDGGKIRRFGQGALNSEKFETTAFALQKKDEISKPIQTKYGWHIIKLIEKHPLKTFEEQKEELTKKVKRDSRSKLVTKSFVDSLRKKYGVTTNKTAITYFKKMVSDSIFTEGWDFTKDVNHKKEIFHLKNEIYTYSDFIEYLQESNKTGRKIADVSFFVDEMYDRFESSTILKYYEKHLEEDNQDFAAVINEYRDGLLLFDLMESKIWNISKTDSIGLKSFYESNKNNYSQNETYKMIKASSSKREAILKVQELLNQKKSIEEIKKEVNKGDVVLVLFSEEELIKEEDKLPKGFTTEQGKTIITEEENFITLFMLKEILPSRIRTFEEIKGEVINDFQKDIENKWLAQLRVKYKVEVNKKALKKVKKELSI